MKENPHSPPSGNRSNARITSASKFLSLVLRHEPGRIGLRLEEGGWVPVAQLLECCANAGRRITPALLQEIVHTNDKKRFSFSEDGLRIRANQGHSITVDLGLAAQEPPGVLYHGTASRFLEVILAQGLQRRSRHHVHLTDQHATAVAVGQRHGKPVVLQVDARRMHAEGHMFYRSDNGVWLTDQVDACYLQLLHGTEARP